MRPDERYQQDPMFRALVDQLEFLIRESRMTPTEVREAAILASIHYEATRLPRFFIDGDDRVSEIAKPQFTHRAYGLRKDGSIGPDEPGNPVT